jgi:adenine-specific DNA methylase
LAAINDESVDFILTDPPYCDNIAYSELSDFFLPWMSQFGLTPNAASPSGMSCNLAAQSRGAASVATFKAGLSECFLQMQRVLKNDGRLVFSYQHRTPDAWEALATALAAGSWCPIQVFPLLGNSPAGLHQHDGTILWDAVTVCRKGTLDADHRDRLRVSNLQISAAIVRAAAWASRLKRARISSFRAADQENLLRAMLVAVALGAFGISGRGKRRSLLDVLAKTPSDLTV